MVGPDDYDEELREEIAIECSHYGTVKDVIIHQDVDELQPVKVFVEFDSMQSVDHAVAGLNRRYFAGRQIVAERYHES